MSAARGAATRVAAGAGVPGAARMASAGVVARALGAAVAVSMMMGVGGCSRIGNASIINWPRISAAGGIVFLFPLIRWM